MTTGNCSTVLGSRTAGGGGARRSLSRTGLANHSSATVLWKCDADILLASSTEDFSRDLAQLPIEALPINSLVPGLSPRSEGVDGSHVERLMEAEWPLKPILVHRQTRQIIDGAHRVAAARRRDMATIDAFLFDGSAEQAFILAVRANVEHGLPLTLEDRRAAARAILAMHSDWSNRRIAATTGVSAGTVDKLRSATEDTSQSNARVGADGRRRPVSTVASRLRAAAILKTRPGMSLREVAREVGLSPGTVRDVRNRLSRGESPLPTAAGRTTPARSKPQPAISRRGARNSVALNSHGTTEVDVLLSALARDPSMRMSQSGRELLRWLHQRSVRAVDAPRIAEATIPDHCVDHVIDLAERCSANWAQLAKLLTRSQHTPWESANELIRRPTG